MSPEATILGKYRILREIGRSNDIVYEAEDPALRRRVALKELLLPPNLTDSQRKERVDRFYREAKAAGGLTHPNIVTIYEVGEDNGRHFIAMEFLEGQSLRETLQQRGALPIQEASDIAIQVCEALAYAHARGVIHRDIKPDNIQILPSGRIKITDFGIARITDDPAITADGQIFGTPSYMSPEQVAGKELDSRTDIFSLGVTLYEMIAGHKPFAGDSVVTITYNIMNVEPPAPPGAPAYLAGIIRKAMAKDPSTRYQMAADMAEDLRQQRSPEPDYAMLQPQPSGYQQGYQPTSTPTAFSHSVPQQPVPPPPVPPIPIAPRKPLLTSSQKNFLAALAIAALVGLAIVFAVWALNRAYQAYKAGLEAIGRVESPWGTQTPPIQPPYDGFPIPMPGQPAPQPDSDSSQQPESARPPAQHGVSDELLYRSKINEAQQAERRGEIDLAAKLYVEAADALGSGPRARQAREYAGVILYQKAERLAEAGDEDHALQYWKYIALSEEFAGTDIAVRARNRVLEAN